MKLEDILEHALTEAITYDEYTDMVSTLVQDERTSGPRQHEDLVYYTKLNAQRSNRLTKTIQLQESTRKSLERLQDKYTWLVITESWCGDAAQTLPLLKKMADANTNITLRIVLRDEQNILMDQFLTNGGRSIPKLIILDGQNQVVGTWGPRPEEAQSLYSSWKNNPDRAPYREFQVEMQKWYLRDKGISTFREVTEIVDTLELSAVFQ